MARGSGTVYVTIGEGQLTLPGTERSCSFRVETTEALGRGVPKETGSARPSGVCRNWQREQLGLRHPVALVLLVVLDHEVAGAHQAGHGRQCVHVGRAVLERAVRGVERVGRGDGAQDLLLAGDEVAVEEGGLGRVDGVAPAVGGEVVAGDGEDPGAGMGRVEVLDRGQLVRRERGGLGEAVGDEVAQEERRVVGHHEAGHEERRWRGRRCGSGTTGRSARCRAA